ncbi:copper resistance protein NlpE [Alteromonas sp. ZYF713]|nr:copper resistance protein NlpE [Alteromonas sp. ZYF713]
MKYLLSILILAACLNLSLTSLTGQALADENQTNNLDSALFGYWYGESIPLPIGGKMVNSRFTYLFLESGQMYIGPEAAVEKASKNQQGTALDSEVRTGTWTVEDGVLLVKWDNGANTKRSYQINGNALEMLNKKGKVVTAYQR